MTIAVLTITSSTDGRLKEFHLGAPNDLQNRIMICSKHDLDVEFLNKDGNFETQHNEAIPLFVLLHWIKLNGYELHSVMPINIEGTTQYERYVFHEQKK